MQAGLGVTAAVPMALAALGGTTAPKREYIAMDTRQGNKRLLVPLFLLLLGVALVHLRAR